MHVITMNACIYMHVCMYVCMHACTGSIFSSWATLSYTLQPHCSFADAKSTICSRAAVAALGLPLLVEIFGFDCSRAGLTSQFSFIE